ncbi:signal peptidase I [Paenibacillus contaminans]|uniref:Signal peptidase I n=1 Tax=Paenibacillus contaminans TaxID=450362 RepID=A0A329MEQ5_9BACL|nr:signal peptidase I [Paenibacillus contaminans]RAV17716.1 signal peptidase I [Paenibacillus contaminans]
MKKILREWLPSLLIAVVVSLFLKAYVAEAMAVPTESMVPTIHVHDRIIVEKITGSESLKVEDIVVFYPPDPSVEHKRYVKRLIGLPGDTIQIREGTLYRNGEKITERYTKEPMRYDFGPVTVPRDKYFFLGDNRNESFDSHLWVTPFVEKDKIIGKVIWQIPVHKIVK